MAGGPLSLSRATAPHFTKQVIAQCIRPRQKHCGQTRLMGTNCRCPCIRKSTAAFAVDPVQRQRYCILCLELAVQTAYLPIGGVKKAGHSVTPRLWHPAIWVVKHCALARSTSVGVIELMSVNPADMPPIMPPIAEILICITASQIPARSLFSSPP